MFFFLLKNIVFTGQEKQNTEDLVKNQFFYPFNFVRSAEFDRNKISRKEKKHALRFASSSDRKIFSPIGPTVSKKKGENLFLLLKTRFWDKHKTIKKCFFSSTLFCCSKLWKNINKQQKLKQFSCQREKCFLDHRFPSFCFLRNYPTPYSSGFCCADRVHQHTHLQMKIKTIEKKFRLRKGGPLNQKNLIRVLSSLTLTLTLSKKVSCVYIIFSLENRRNRE